MINTKISKTGEPAVIIEPKDLRIGSVLLFEGRLVHVTTLSMDIDDEYEETIGFCDLGKSSNEICDRNRALCDRLKPIPLTPEVLEKAGFRKKEEDSIYYTKEGHALIFFSQNPTLECHVGNEVTLYVINYLHQLQNIYHSLTGEELILNLPSPTPDKPVFEKPFP